MGMIHVQKFVLTAAATCATVETKTAHERREECNFSPIDESPLQNDSTSGSLLVAAVLFAAAIATSATYYVVAALTRPSEEGSGCKLGAKNRHHFPSTKSSERQQQ